MPSALRTSERREATNVYVVAVSTIKPTVVTSTSVGPEAATEDGPVVATLLVWPVLAAGLCAVDEASSSDELALPLSVVPASPEVSGSLTETLDDPVSRATLAWCLLRYNPPASKPASASVMMIKLTTPPRSCVCDFTICYPCSLYKYISFSMNRKTAYAHATLEIYVGHSRHRGHKDTCHEFFAQRKTQ